jgi:Cu-Zn family superoxide dismutase
MELPECKSGKYRYDVTSSHMLTFNSGVEIQMIRAQVVGLVCLMGLLINTSAAAQTAVGELQARSGSNVTGIVTLTETTEGLLIEANVQGLSPNSSHGFHIHDGFDCDTPDASSAGPHFNPTDMPHGAANSPHSHAGDLPNLQTTSDGTAVLSTLSQEVSLQANAKNNVLGRTLVVHAGPDDHTSQPAGNSGDRIACAVIVSAQ